MLTGDAVRLPVTPPAPLGFRVVLPLLVAGAAVVAFLPALDAGFVQWDDDKVVCDNPHFRGFTRSNLTWMFTRTKMGHYHPLTWMSYGLDHAVGASRYDAAPPEVQARYFQGLDPRIFHLSNLLLHAGVAVGFYFLARLLLRLLLPPPPGRPDTAAAVAAAVAALLFAVHPLRVETVAWVTERRDVLSSIFLLPSLLCYLRYALTDRPGLRRAAYYGSALLLLVLSLLSKAWGITLPALMLVLDVYPLRRLGGRSGWTSPRALRAYLEKVPFVVVAFAFAIKAKSAQGEALDTLKTISEWGYLDRLAQAAYGLVFYCYKTLAPLDLAPLVEIPPQHDPFALRYVLAAAIVLVAGVLLVRFRKRWPAGVVAVVCYVGAISPVLGIVQSGPQLVADRYSYLACLPWALLGGAGLLWLARNRTRGPWTARALPVAGAAALVLCATFAALAWRQTRIWRDSHTLWAHTLEVYPDCVLAHVNLGMLERQAGRTDVAIAYYKKALQIDPTNYLLLNNLAVALREDPAGLDEAIALLREAVARQPRLADLHFSLAAALEQNGQLAEALAELDHCVELKGDQPKYYRSLGRIHLERREYAAAEGDYRRALALERRLDPHGVRVADALERLGLVYLRMQRLDDAEAHCRQALDITRQAAAQDGTARQVTINALDRLGWIMLAREQADEALRFFEQILTLDPHNRGARTGIARARRQAAR